MEQRKQDILKAVVNEFTATAVPVGSHALVTRHFVTLSSATIRSELAELADLGYLLQPHTSAGRVPSDRGYRYFVDFLMDFEPVPQAVRAYIEDELRTAPADAQALVEKVAQTTAAVTANAAVVSAPHGARVRVKHVDLVSLEPRDVLMILLVEGNLLRQQVVRLSRDATQADLSRLAAHLNRDLAGKERDAVEARVPRVEDGLEKELLVCLRETLDLFERGSETMAVHDGVRNLLRQPEFAEAARLQDVLEVLEETRYLTALLRELAGSGDVQIVIGSENVTEQLRSCTVVLTTYGPTARLRGILGVVGPTRIRYGQIVSRLRVVAAAASERMAELHA